MNTMNTTGLHHLTELLQPDTAPAWVAALILAAAGLCLVRLVVILRRLRRLRRRGDAHARALLALRQKQGETGLHDDHHRFARIHGLS